MVSVFNCLESGTHFASATLSTGCVLLRLLYLWNLLTVRTLFLLISLGRNIRFRNTHTVFSYFVISTRILHYARDLFIFP